MTRLNDLESIAAANRFAAAGCTAEDIYFNVKGITYERAKIAAIQAKTNAGAAEKNPCGDAGENGDGRSERTRKDKTSARKGDSAGDQGPGRMIFTGHPLKHCRMLADALRESHQAKRVVISIEFEDGQSLNFESQNAVDF